MIKQPNYAVLGSGAWGTALANMLCNKAVNCLLFTRDSNTAKEINKYHTNQKYLGAIKLNPALKASTSLAEIVSIANRIILAVPAQQTRQFLNLHKELIANNIPIILSAKGIELNTGLFMSQVVNNILPFNAVALLSGPSFAEDVAKALPTAITLAANNLELANVLSNEISSDNFRCYSTNDLIGAEIGGSLKNVFAIASGAACGAGFGDSARAALVTRSFAEMRRIGLSFGAKITTLCGLSGLGDLMLTCNSEKSRNFAYGYALGKNITPANKLNEGCFTAKIAANICREKHIDAPLIFAVEALLNGKINIKQIYNELLNRPLKIED